MKEAQILDPCCGSKMFYFDKNDSRVLFGDIRDFETELCDGRTLKVKPNIKLDFRNLPFENEKFKMVVFDPPHIVNIGEKSWMALKYGKLEKSWKHDISRGFSECFRVLENGGFLIFKWNECQIKVSDILKLTDQKPVFGHKSGKNSKTHWICFMKGEV